MLSLREASAEARVWTCPLRRKIGGAKREETTGISWERTKTYTEMSVIAEGRKDLIRNRSNAQILIRRRLVGGAVGNERMIL